MQQWPRIHLRLGVDGGRVYLCVQANSEGLPAPGVAGPAQESLGTNMTTWWAIYPFMTPCCLGHNDRKQGCQR
jgi:hypothetical protein